MENLTEIKSPYAIFEGETCFVEETENVISGTELAFLLKGSFLRQLEYRILLIINILRAVNIKQLVDMLSVEYGSIQKTAAERAVRKLVDKNFLTRIVFKAQNMTAVRYVYCLAENSAVALQTRVDFDPRSVSIEEFKGILATNQLITCAKKSHYDIIVKTRECEQVQSGILMGTKLICYDAKFSIYDTDYYAYVIRKSHNWKEKMRSLIPMLNHLLHAVGRNVRVIVIGEDADHVAEILPYIKNMHGITVLYDREIYLKGFDRCLGI